MGLVVVDDDSAVVCFKDGNFLQKVGVLDGYRLALVNRESMV